MNWSVECCGGKWRCWSMAINRCGFCLHWQIRMVQTTAFSYVCHKAEPAMPTILTAYVGPKNAKRPKYDPMKRTKEVS